jgi:hypothetical protein
MSDDPRQTDGREPMGVEPASLTAARQLAEESRERRRLGLPERQKTTGRPPVQRGSPRVSGTARG